MLLSQTECEDPIFFCHLQEQQASTNGYKLSLNPLITNAHASF